MNLANLGILLKRYSKINLTIVAGQLSQLKENSRFKCTTSFGRLLRIYFKTGRVLESASFYPYGSIYMALTLYHHKYSLEWLHLWKTEITSSTFQNCKTSGKIET